MPGPANPEQTLAVTGAADDRTALATDSPTGEDACIASEPAVGSKVGRWLLVRLLGRGGMGAVFLAERTEHDFRQCAALKLIKLGMDSSEIQQRFLVERRILARLEHPNIARLIDGGVDQRGRPYFVMEWVDGTPLTEYANARRLDLSSRVQLFLKLCDAVAHAHRQLVVHRDLKPGNVLVDARGEPKLLDFGIAKVLESDNTEDTSATGPRFFTRAYAAPEQVRGEPVNTATDIYALGAVLFELLAGTPLHRVRGDLDHTRELLAQARRIAGDDGPPLVTARMLAGDLALVVAMAVRSEPARRYASVEAFADDLRAALHGHPVRARPDSTAYRLTRFVRRHWIVVGASAAVLLAMVGGAGVALWQAQIARAEAQRAEAVSAFLSTVFESATSDGAGGSSITARSLLQRGSERIERELAGQPALRARLHAKMGKAWYHIGESGRATEIYELGRAAVDADDWRTQAELLRGLAEAELALGQIRQARTHVDQASALLEDRGPDTDLDRALTIMVSKSVLGAEGDPAGARDLARGVHAELSRLLGPQAETTLEAQNDVGTWTLEAGDPQAALAIFDQVIDLRRSSASGPDHPELATAMHNRVLALIRLDRLDDALKGARAVVELRRRILPQLHRDLASSLGVQANIESRLGHLASARELRSEAIALLRAQRRPDTMLLGLELTNQATDAIADGDFAAAAGALREALELLEPRLDASHASVLAANRYLGLVESLQGRLAAAEQRLQAVARAESAHGSVPLGERLATRRYLARALRWQGRPDEALRALVEADAWLRQPGANTSSAARSRFAVEMALAQLGAGQREPALASLEVAAAAHAATAVTATDRAQLQLARARLALAGGDAAAAREQAGAALDTLQQALGDRHWEVGEARGLLAIAAWQLHATPAARIALTEALAWHEAQRPWHPDTLRLRELAGSPAAPGE